MIGVLSVRPVARHDTDWRAFEDLLGLAKLPRPGPEEGCRVFAVEDEVGLLGFGGLDGAGADQMLRSVVLAPGLRHRGLGRVLVARLVHQARADSAMRLWLLTTEADHWFAGLGWSPATRDQDPEPAALPSGLPRVLHADAAPLGLKRAGPGSRTG